MQAAFIAIGAFLLLFVVWIYTGGPDRAGYENPPGESPPLWGTGEDMDLEEKPLDERLEGIENKIEEIKKTLRALEIQGVASPYAGLVDLSGGRPRAETAREEYLSLRTRSGNNAPVLITGWRLESIVTGKSAVIGNAVPVYRSGQVNHPEPVALTPGERVELISGRSPLGVSFQQNACMGYLSKRQTFIPSIRGSCPDPDRELELYSTVAIADRECFEFVRGLASCEIVSSRRADDFSPACETFLLKQLSYNGCVATHLYEHDFFEDKWHIYFGKGADLWRDEGDIIRLLDQEGRTVDVLMYE